MTEGQVQILQSPVQPTVIVASTSSPTRYKSYNSKVNVTLGIIQIGCGVLLMALTIALLVENSPLSPISDGIWCGIIIILSGSFQIAAGKSKNKYWIVTSLVFSILAAVFVIPVLVVGSLDIEESRHQERRYKYRLRDWEDYRYSDSYWYYPQPEAKSWDAFYASNGLRILVAVAEGIVAIAASAMACGPLCCTTTQTTLEPQVQYVAHQPGQQVIMVSPQHMHQPAVVVPMAMQQGYTAPVLTPAGAPPMYTTIPAAPVATQMATPQAQPMPTPTVQQTGTPEKGTIG